MTSGYVGRPGRQAAPKLNIGHLRLSQSTRGGLTWLNAKLFLKSTRSQRSAHDDDTNFDVLSEQNSGTARQHAQSGTCHLGMVLQNKHEYFFGEPIEGGLADLRGLTSRN